jgi:nucleotide-binding universal stress UspA family protein
MAEVFLPRILVPVDDSLSNLLAQETAVHIARKTGATVTILHVIPEFRTIYEYSQSFGSEVVFSEEERSKLILSKASTLFQEENVPSNILTGRGDPAVTILEYATPSYGLVIMGACGEHESDLYKLGSVTKKVELHIHRPILVAKKSARLLTSWFALTVRNTQLKP